MKLNRLSCVLAGLLLCLAAGPAMAESQIKVTDHYGQSVRGMIGETPFVVLRGTLQERMEAYGVLCGRDVMEIMGVLVPVAQSKSPKGWEALAAAAKQGFAFTDGEQQEMNWFLEGFRKAIPEADRKIAKLGRDLTLDDLKGLQCFGDLASSGKMPAGGCSSFSAWGELTEDGNVITGRNGDYATYPGRFPFLVMAQQPSEKDVPATLEVTGAGIFGANTVMNERGVFLALHDSWGAPFKATPPWRPRVMPLRPAIEHAKPATALEDIAATMRNVPLAMGGSIVVSMPIDPAKAGVRPAIIEWKADGSGDGTFVRKAHASVSSDAVLCTNHYLGTNGLNATSGGSTFDRFRAMAGIVRGTQEAHGKIDVAAAKKILDAAAVNGDSTTYLSVVAIPHLRQMHVAFTPKTGVSATKGTWVQVDWERLFAAR